MSRTQGKLTHRSFSIYAADGKTPVADTCLTNSVANHDVENARRLVACWNACESFPTDDLEACPEGGLFHLADHANQLAIERDSLRAVNAELLEALEGLLQLEEEDHQRGPGDEDVCLEVRKARAAIASARKQGEQG